MEVKRREEKIDTINPKHENVKERNKKRQPKPESSGNDLGRWNIDLTNPKNRIVFVL